MPSVLLLEDDDGVRALLCEALEASGYTVKCLSDYAEAERQLATGRYGLLVTDVRMPHGSGHNLAQDARARGMKVIVVTGHPDEMKLMMERDVFHLQKPFRVELFLDTVEQICAA